MSNRKRLLVIEDDEAIVGLLKGIAEGRAWDIETELDGKAGLERALQGNYDLLILDLQLPSMDGFEICRRVRNALPNVGILILTSRVEESDKVVGLELGADDYVTKPFSSRELEARMKAMLRRSEVRSSEAEEETVLNFGKLSINLFNRSVSLDGKAVKLTATEFALLILLASYPGKTFTRQELLEQIWGYRAQGNEPTLGTHLSRLRQKLEPDPMQPIYIITVHGVGYRFEGGGKPGEL